MDDWTCRPQFSVIIHSAEQSSDTRRSIRSIERQIYPQWRFFEAATETINKDIIAAGGDFIVLLRAGDQLSEGALFRYAEALQANRDALILYGDEDRINDQGKRSQPWFKPCWNEELFFAQDYLSAAITLRADLAKRVASTNDCELATFILDATAAADGKIVHIPHIMTHVAAQNRIPADRLRVVQRSVEPRGGRCAEGPFGTIKVEWPLPRKLPLVSIIIPTKDKLELLQRCVSSVLRLTDYKNFEIIIVDNGSTEEATLRFFDEIEKNLNIRVLTYERPFNYSAINNLAVRSARGSYVCLLNNDTEVLEPCWLRELMRYAIRPEIGAAGAKLLYEDGSIQHAGVVVGIGEAAGHAHRYLRADDPGYFRMAHVAQFATAVTGACLVVQKKKFESVGGLDEEKLAIAFNDVDLCLKLKAAGWQNVYVPHAVLLHHESRSRGHDMAPTHVDRYRRELSVLQERWRTKTYQDPLHNPNLDRSSESFVFKL